MYLCIAFEKSTSVKLKKFGSLAQLNRASDYGSEGYRFESCANHHQVTGSPVTFFCIYSAVSCGWAAVTAGRGRAAAR